MKCSNIIPLRRTAVISRVIPAQAAILQWRRCHEIPGPRTTACLGILVFIMALQFEQAHALELRGHFKPQLTVVNIPGNSLLQDFSDDPAIDTNLDLRLNTSGGSGRWSWRSDYQLLAGQGDQLELRQQNPDLGFNTLTLADD